MGKWLCILLFMCHLKTFYAKCGGKSEINDVLNGTIEIGNPYPENTHCQWLIRAPSPGQKIKVIFQMFATECSFDYLKVYAGASTAAELLAAFSGDTLPPVLLSNSSSVLLDFFSDNNYFLKGWTVYFEIYNCSGGCSGRGSCAGNQCICDELYTGNACDVKLCPQMCNNITGHGECSKVLGECTCNTGYVGQSCSLFLHGDADVGAWHLINQNSDIFHARFGHAGVYVKENSAFWIFGGSDLNKFFGDLVKFDFTENKWLLINTTASSPAARFRHSMVTYKNTVVLFGGELANGTLMNDIWSFNISRSEWKLLPNNGSGIPPGLASHTANVVGDKLIIFGGRSDKDVLSNEMYTYDLSLIKGWEKVVYRLGKKSDLRLAGHSSVYYRTLRSLVVFGGFLHHRYSYFSEKTNAMHMYNVEHKVWIKVRETSSHRSYLPEPRAYHSSVVAGDYMVIYGGNVHEHGKDETCYENKLHLFNLKYFTWVSPSLLTGIGPPTNSSWQPQRGRFSQVASVLNDSTILVSGGFSGIPHTDLLAFKLPTNIAAGSVDNNSHCSFYDEHGCGLDPSCVWCKDNPSCLSMHQWNTCSMPTSSATPDICSVFDQCVSCLMWGSQPDLACGWCVQDSRCYPRSSPSGMCSSNTTGNTYSTRGWWGERSIFLTLLDQCRTEDKPPGLMVNVRIRKKDTPRPDISIMNVLRKTFYIQSRQSDTVYVKMSGFIYPYLTSSVNRNVDIKLRVSKQSVSLRFSTDEDPSNSEKIISFGNDHSVLKVAGMINDSVRLFPNPSVNKMYYMEINSEFKTNDNVNIDVSMDGILLNGTYVRPFFSSDCSVHTSCLRCLSDASCGWYSNNNICVRRDNSAFSYSGENVYLIINATFCDTCAQYIDCTSCMNTANCEWNQKQLFCDYLGQYMAVDSQTCLKPCSSNSGCGSCVKDLKCIWCENKQKCIPRFSYVPDHLHSQCSHWSNGNTKVGKCRNCSKRNICKDCNKESYCGWCGEYHTGKCFDGEYNGPRDGQCEQLMASNVTNRSLWSYTRCPDENECITQKNCHANATCTNLDPGYKCECRIGFEGDGYHCNVSCNPPCAHGKCSPSLTCDCDLGWTGNFCSQDCGCNYHSSCHTGIGICDKCQEFTHGEYCEICRLGSFGNATTSFGCHKCECNGHGDERRGICDIKTGDCFCLNHTMGKHCNQCLPGLVGYPEQGGGCYHPCESHLVLSNVTDGALSTSIGSGTSIKGDTNCVWIITTLRNESKYIVYTNEDVTGSITLRIKDLKVDCQTDHAYVYEGFPPYKLEDLHTSLHSSFNLIGTVCGFDASNVPTIESRTGTLVVIFKGNLGRHSSTKGFNFTFVINQCPNACTGNRDCFNNGTHHECVCKAGWAGPGCDDVICPSNCSEKLGQGYCDQALKSCVCTKGFVGKSCEIRNPFNNFIWELMFNIDGKSSTLPRMGHTIVADEITQSLIIYGGYSFSYGVLGDTWIYDITNRNYVRAQYGSQAPSPRYLHAGAVYKRQMYISGGKMDKDFSSELWKFGLDNKQWTKAQILPSRVAGHSLSVVNDTMYLIGGYDPDSYCSTEVYVLDLKLNLPWTKLSTFGHNFKPCFGHTTVYDKKTKSLIIFGKDAEQIMSGSGSATLAVLHLSTNEWSVESVPSQSYSRYFHSSLFVGDVMIVTGGYTDSGRVQDFAEISLVFNIRCRQWEKFDKKGVFSPILAHSSIAATNDEVYLFGGYNGLASDKLFRLNISSDWCSMFSTRDKCVGIGGCYWCFVNSSNQSFCFSSNINSPHNCSSDVAPGNQCMLNPVTAALRNGISSSDICAQYSLSDNCSSCIVAKDNGKSGSCFWAVDSRRCLSAHFSPILCVFGICGQLLREYDTCPGLCNRTHYCHDCLEQSNCGWCTDSRGNGNGICMEGTIEGSLNGTCQKKNLNLGLPVTTPIWVWSVCLLEDECLNKHHQCNENETCFNLENGYECRCKSGYIRQLSKCVPVCDLGCVKGICIAPNVCRCYFGMVGLNCSTPCDCFGKGHCLDENQLDNCTDCQNNTTGRSCERCLLGFIGHDGICNPCSEKCNKNADECKNKETSPYGPRDDGTHYCTCKDNSKGIHCDSCENGFFKLKPDSQCKRCECRGHASTCIPHNGLGCDCQNNTIAPHYCSNSIKNRECYKLQCSKCDSNYVGDPVIEGQQCYRTMNVLGHFLLTRDKLGNSRLLPGQTNFFSIHPNFINADVRLTLDVFDGSIDVYIATENNAFRVASNQTVSISSSSIPRLDVHSDGLNKYVMFPGDSSVAVVKEVKRRLVVTFPFEEHNLDGKQFHVIVKAGSSGADGITYFKQDNVKIYIVVFFAVFFSCFFLVLSVVVIGWSIKQHIHSRREVHNRDLQNERMQSRPFAKFAFLFEYQPPSRSMLRYGKTTGSTRKAIRAMGMRATNDYRASVTTVMIQMPQTDKIKMSLMLGTTLTTINANDLDRFTLKTRKPAQQTTTL